MQKLKSILSIAGSDSSGGAGIQADIKTITTLGGYAASVITAVTSQNTQGVQGIHDIPLSVIKSQIKSVIDDIDVRVIKTGMLNNPNLIKFIGKNLSHKKLIVDPVMVAASGDILVEKSLCKVIKVNLLPSAFLVTPNIYEAEILSGIPIKSIDDQIQSAKLIKSFGAKNVLVKGGHMNEKILADVLLAGNKIDVFKHKKIITKNTHGTGCTLASAIATKIAQGHKMSIAVKTSIDYVQVLLKKSPKIGKGSGPLAHNI